MTTRLTVSSLAMPITIKANTTFSAPLAVNAIGPFVIALGTTSKGALATVNLKSIGDVAAAKTTLILPGNSTDYIFKTASGAVTISTSTTNPTTHKVTTTVIASLDLTKVAVDTPLVKFADLTAKFHPTSTKSHVLTVGELLTVASPAIPTLLHDTGSIATDGITNDGTLNVNPHTTGGVISYSIDGGKTYATGALPEGVYAAGKISVVETSTNGSVSKATTNTTVITVDKTAPAAATKIALDTDTGIATDNITSDGSINITGTLEAKAHWEYSVNGGTTFTAVAADATSFVVPASATAYAANQIQVKQVDAAGNSSAVTKLATALTVDDTVALPAFALATDSGTAGDGVTNVATVNVTGIETGATWQYSLNGTDFVDGTGTSFTLPTGETTYDAGQIIVRQTDIAGNESDAGGKFATNSVDWTIDTVATAPTFNDVAGDNVISYAEQKDAAGVTVTGTTEIGAAVSVEIGTGAKAAATVDAEGKWSYKLPDAQLTAGTIKLTAITTDKAGNVSTAATKDVVVSGPAVAIDVTHLTATGTADADIYAIASGSYAATINNFAAGDKLRIFEGASITIQPDANLADGIKVLSITDPTAGTTATITLKDLTPAQDAALYNVSSFDTLGTDTLKITSPVAVPTTTTNINSSTLTGAGTDSVDTFNVASGSYKATIANFKPGDKLKFFTGAAINIGNAAAIPATTTNITSTVLTGTGTDGVDTFNIASGSFRASIANFKPGDKLTFFAGASINVVQDTNQGDGYQEISATDPNTGATAIIALTGLTPAQDDGAFNVPGFNNVFGSGSLV